MKAEEKTGGAVVEMKQFVVDSGRGPVVRFTGVLLSHTTEKKDRWAIYRTKGGNYVLSRRGEYRNDVKDFKKPKLIVSYLRMIARWERERSGSQSPRDWSPRADYGVSEAVAKMIMDAGPEISQFLVRDVE